METPLVERTYEVILPSRRHARVNVFDMNLAIAADSDGYIQLEDTSWIKAKALKIVPNSVR